MDDSENCCVLTRLIWYLLGQIPAECTSALQIKLVTTGHFFMWIGRAESGIILRYPFLGITLKLEGVVFKGKDSIEIVESNDGSHDSQCQISERQGERRWSRWLCLWKEWEEKEENTVEIVESDEVSYETARGPDWAMPSNRSSTLYLIL